MTRVRIRLDRHADEDSICRATQQAAAVAGRYTDVVLICNKIYIFSGPPQQNLWVKFDWHTENIITNGELCVAGGPK